MLNAQVAVTISGDLAKGRIFVWDELLREQGVSDPSLQQQLDPKYSSSSSSEPESREDPKDAEYESFLKERFGKYMEKRAAAKGKGKKSLVGEYDLDDPFICDDEVVSQSEEEQPSAGVQKVNFFIADGAAFEASLNLGAREKAAKKKREKVKVKAEPKKKEAAKKEPTEIPAKRKLNKKEGEKEDGKKEAQKEGCGKGGSQPIELRPQDSDKKAAAKTIADESTQKADLDLEIFSLEYKSAVDRFCSLTADKEKINKEKFPKSLQGPLWRLVKYAVLSSPGRKFPEPLFSEFFPTHLPYSGSSLRKLFLKIIHPVMFEQQKSSNQDLLQRLQEPAPIEHQSSQLDSSQPSASSFRIQSDVLYAYIKGEQELLWLDYAVRGLEEESLKVPSEISFKKALYQSIQSTLANDSVTGADIARQFNIFKKKNLNRWKGNPSLVGN